MKARLRLLWAAAFFAVFILLYSLELLDLLHYYTSTCGSETLVAEYNYTCICTNGSISTVTAKVEVGDFDSLDEALYEITGVKAEYIFAGGPSCDGDTPVRIEQSPSLRGVSCSFNNGLVVYLETVRGDIVPVFGQYYVEAGKENRPVVCNCKFELVGCPCGWRCFQLYMPFYLGSAALKLGLAFLLVALAVYARRLWGGGRGASRA